MYKEERDVLEEEMREIDGCYMEEFGTLDISEKTIAILGDRWWLQAAKQEGDKFRKKNRVICWKQRNERPNVGDLSIRSKNGAPSRKGCVANGKITDQGRQQMSTPSPPRPQFGVIMLVFGYFLIVGFQYGTATGTNDIGLRPEKRIRITVKSYKGVDTGNYGRIAYYGKIIKRRGYGELRPRQGTFKRKPR